MSYSNKNGTINGAVTSGSLNSSYAVNMPNTVEEQDYKNNRVINEINALKEKEIVDAKNSYSQNMAGYGVNAAALSAMGLTGSGYSDYMNAKAYATYRNEVQQANTKAQNSLISYQDGLNNKYLEILSELEQGGGGSADYMTQLSDQLGFTKDQKESLVKKAKYNEVISGLGSQTFGSASEVMNYINGYINSDADESSKTKVRDEAISVIKANGFDSTGITDGYMQNALASAVVKGISAEKYNSLNDGDDITVKINGNSYKVESKGISKNSDVLKYATSSNLKDGNIFAYGDNDDLYIYNDGKVYEVGSKHWNTKYNEQYNDVRHYVLTGKERTEQERKQSKQATQKSKSEQTKQQTSNNPRSKNYKK